MPCAPSAAWPAAPIASFMFLKRPIRKLLLSLGRQGDPHRGGASPQCQMSLNISPAELAERDALAASVLLALRPAGDHCQRVGAAAQAALGAKPQDRLVLVRRAAGRGDEALAAHEPDRHGLDG